MEFIDRITGKSDQGVIRHLDLKLDGSCVHLRMMLPPKEGTKVKSQVTTVVWLDSLQEAIGQYQTEVLGSTPKKHNRKNCTIVHRWVTIAIEAGSKNPPWEIRVRTEAIQALLDRYAKQVKEEEERLREEGRI